MSIDMSGTMNIYIYIHICAGNASIESDTTGACGTKSPLVAKLVLAPSHSQINRFMTSLQELLLLFQKICLT